MNIIDIIYLIIYAIMFFCSTLWLVVFLSNRRHIFNNPKAKKLPSVTFLVPAYNEEKNIRKCLKSLLNLNYPRNKIKIFVIDDGSTDNTENIVREFSRKYKNIKFFKKKHGGKASCLNYGLKFVKTECFACMDADSVASKNYLRKMVGYFKNKNVAAVTPAMKIFSPNTLIRKIQWVEYIFSIFLRKLFSIFDCQYVVPGPGGLYRTRVMLKLGGFDEKSLTEDMEAAFKIIHKGYRIENAIDAYVRTQSPKNFRALYKQRIRWYRGYLQTVSKYSFMILNPKYGNLGFFLLPMNFVWILILGFLFFMPVVNLFNKLYTSALSWTAINYAIMKPEINISIFYLDFYTFFSATFFFFAILSIYLSIKCSKERIDIRNRKIFYFAYLFFYPLLLSIFWISAVLYEALRVEKRW